MQDSAQKLLKTHVDDAHLAAFAQRLSEWLIADLNQSEEPVPDFTDSRAKALMRAANVVDDPTLHDFVKKMGVGETPALSNVEGYVRIALFDLLTETELATDDEVQAIASVSGSTAATEDSQFSWFALSIAAHAWKSGYPLHQLDPASPPGEYSPAGQLVKRAAYFMRKQVQRSATERDKLARKLAYEANSDSGTPNLDTMSQEQPIAPVPPHFRPPIPVNYPEVSSETLQIEPNEPEPLPTPTISTDAPLQITLDDLPDDEQRPIRMPSIRITEDQLSRPAPAPAPRPQPRPSSSSRAVRGRSREPMRTTKLRVVVQDYPGGAGMYGLQVKGNRSRCQKSGSRHNQRRRSIPMRIACTGAIWPHLRHRHHLASRPGWPHRTQIDHAQRRSNAVCFHSTCGIIQLLE